MRFVNHDHDHLDRGRDSQAGIETNRCANRRDEAADSDNSRVGHQTESGGGQRAGRIGFGRGAALSFFFYALKRVEMAVESKDLFVDVPGGQVFIRQ